MSFYDDPKNAEKYIDMAKGYDGAALIDFLKKELATGSGVLELGMGPGTDLEILSKDFEVTGSDNAGYFVERYKGLNPDTDLLILDAVTMDTDRKFDAIYSNKVLHCLSNEELDQSFARQASRLNQSGIVLHSFWLGDEVMDVEDMSFHYRKVDDVTQRLAAHFDLIDAQQYTEMEENDSFWVMARKR